MNVKGPFVFDSHALLKFFQKERGYETIVRLLRDINAAGRTKYLNAINLGEIIYTTKRTFGDQQKIAILAHIERLGFTILPAPNTLIFQAAEYKAQYSISFADCFALASAVEQKAPIVTGDPEFRKVAELVDVVWV